MKHFVNRLIEFERAIPRIERAILHIAVLVLIVKHVLQELLK